MTNEVVRLAHFDTPLIFGVELSFLITGLAIVITLSLGILFYLNSKGNATNRLLAYFCFANVFYNIINYTTINPGFASVADPAQCQGSTVPLSQSLYLCLGRELWLIRLVMSSWAFMFPILLLLAYTYSQKIFSVSKKHLAAILIWFGVISVLGLTPLVFSGIDTAKALQNGIIAPQPFIGMPLYALSVFGSVIWSVIVLWKKRKTTQGVERIYFQYLVGTLVLYFLLTLIFNFIFPAGLGNPKFVQYGPLFILPFLLACAYIIFRHHFVATARLLATQLFVTGFWLILLLQVFLAGSFNRMVISSFILASSIGFGYLIIRSVFLESEQRRQVEHLNSQLDDLNHNLQQKVAEQTIEIRKSYEVEKKARIELEELDKAKDQFILTTEHHLRTPLTIVKGYLQSILSGKSEPLGENTRSYLTKAEEATDRIGNLINEFLDISQMEVGKNILNRTRVNIKELIGNALKELEPEIKKKNLSLKVDIEDGTTLNLDKTKVREVLINVIDNGIKYNKPNGSLTITGVKTTHPIEKDKQIYKIVVHDTGIGLIPEELAKLFTQYFQRGKEAEKIYTTGKGISLAVTKNIIQAHGGRIYAESDGRGKGSTFFIELEI